MNNKVVELFFTDSKNKRRLDIISGLLEGKTPIELAEQYGVSRQAVTDIRKKYLSN
ncbi:helix-turn-helix domain-containing protein [Vibrio comitans]|nr:helix-turn-helix domain-containing protein [Vibrio comitans]